MARPEEADPRWIVKERQDGKNCNNWHWSEKDLMGFVRPSLTQDFENVTLKQIEAGTVTITKLLTAEGEAYVNNRKGKNILIYDLNVSLEWQAKWNGVDTKGRIEMPYISEENDLDDFEIKVTCDDSHDAAYQAKQVIHKDGFPIIRKIIVNFLKALQKAGGEGAKRASENTPKNKVLSDEVISSCISTTPAATPTPAVPAAAATPKAPKEEGDTRTISLTSTFRAPPAEIYECFTSAQKLSIFCQCQAIFEPAEGKPFALFDGQIVGENVTLRPGEKIVQKWRFKDWPEDKPSLVTILFAQTEPGVTRLSLTQSGVPKADVSRTEEGWQSRFFERIKMVFGYGDSMPF